jgi:hypothetical protein
MRHREKESREEERDDDEGDGGGEERINERLVELSVHGCTTGLQRSAENDERHDP